MTALQQLSPSDFQQQLRDARIAYDQTVMVRQQSNFWTLWGHGLTNRYNAEQQEFLKLSNGN